MNETAAALIEFLKEELQIRVAQDNTPFKIQISEHTFLINRMKGGNIILIYSCIYNGFPEPVHRGYRIYATIDLNRPDSIQNLLAKIREVECYGSP